MQDHRCHLYGLGTRPEYDQHPGQRPPPVRVDDRARTDSIRRSTARNNASGEFEPAYVMRPKSMLLGPNVPTGQSRGHAVALCPRPVSWPVSPPTVSAGIADVPGSQILHCRIMLQACSLPSMAACLGQAAERAGASASHLQGDREGCRPKRWEAPVVAGNGRGCDPGPARRDARYRVRGLRMSLAAGGIRLWLGSTLHDAHRPRAVGYARSDHLI